ncbi:MAG TPA: outer membrane beta-barrel protein [Bryobacteraceae bacterium]|nr:outer membrane beta-barrel protein [Bryobacteraceae bacterium]
MPLRALLSFAVLSIVFGGSARAQDSRINTNLGVGVTVPVNPTAALIGAGVNVVVGVGYNFDKHHSLVGQFMWSGLPLNQDALRPIRILANTRDISTSSNLFAVTGNYRYRIQGKVFGGYIIAGGGVYYRRVTLSRQVPVGIGTVCGPTWQWLGYACVSGIITDDQTLIRSGSTAFGGNAGVGFTIRINEEGYKFYVESRYHYAPTKNIATQIIPITLGFSW